MRIHAIKCHDVYYQRTLDGDKPFEIRLNNRDYQTGDVLEVSEILTETAEPTGRQYRATISYMTNYAQQDGYVVLGLMGVEVMSS